MLAKIAGRVIAAAFVASLALSCQAIVNGDLPAYTCTGTDPKACPAGQYCKGAGCAPCEKDDMCDGFDNDCNGKVDDGPKSDRDMDGWSYCGVGTEPDCDDSDPTIHPKAQETCNGKDDNCDGSIDENICALPDKCSPKLGKCVTNPCDPMDPKSCTNPQVCDPGTLQCVNPASKKIGDGCTADSECEMGLLCAGSNVLANKLGPGAFCVKTCCTSQDCPSGFVCYGPGTGGNYCLSATTIGRPAPGNLQAGAMSGSASSCRSGLLMGGRCGDTCCNPSQCASGTSCMLTMLDGHRTLGCHGGFGPGKQDDDCNGSSSCSAGGCFSYAWGAYRACIMPCCGSASCGVLFGGAPTVCWNMDLGAGDYAPLCGQAKSSNGGNAPTGAACTQNNQCRSDRCHADKYCTDVCCMDSDCPGGMVCRPTDLGGRALRCVKPK